MLRLFILFFLIVPCLGFPQKIPTYLSIDGGGNGVAASANIAKPVFVHQRFKIIAQAGLGWNPKTVYSDLPFSIPAQLTACFGKETFFFEAGLGSTFIYKGQIKLQESEKKSNMFYLSPIIGFRHESQSWFARMYINPLFRLNGNTLYDEVTRDALNFGISIGTIIK
ncbi:hypothetical protein [uncultured Draconibacterium sp.]|uniref:hypothetical protein n=1 Tax=uncultured Draconibacterium sp. TaxID=1573823 RepID=UPI00321787B8